MCPNSWDDKYGQQEFFYGKEPNTFLVEKQNYFL
jgi:hypothetical protein